MVRDKRMDRQYFEKWSDYNQQAVDRFRTKIEADNTTATHRRRLAHTRCTRSLELVLLAYSGGGRVDEHMKEHFVASVDAFLD